ncbi:hypothetical protein [Chryseobacterium taklimakanense]|uniref:Uncharacterized protein n=1 Tax=Chryseobacterium taklimakanense TaxID=536441 RepID=A0A3G8WL80_9FLAO|nr:hypothetical protein [Chryseobacterium taklimakanense]AZI20988.1 hypothetical protein EIH08_10060 [Chryseobacterium taklimakanense]
MRAHAQWPIPGSGDYHSADSAEKPQYISGEIDLKDGRVLYLNRALGHSYQLRFTVRPKITLSTLTKF